MDGEVSDPPGPPESGAAEHVPTATGSVVDAGGEDPALAPAWTEVQLRIPFLLWLQLRSSLTAHRWCEVHLPGIVCMFHGF